MLKWLAESTYGWLWIDPERERREQQAAAAYSHPVAVAEREAQARLDRSIARYLATAKPRQPAKHYWNPLTNRCSKCRIGVIENAAVPYGYGIPCEGK